jgi:O-antigen/teichoic acid export membrane protein
MMNFSYTLSSNLISLIISTLVVLVVPKLIGVEKYGYWQLYLFYTSYVGFMHLGWIDGIYLRYGGKDYAELDKKVFFSQFYMLLVTQVVVAGIILILSGIFSVQGDKLFIFQMTAICLVISNMRYLLIFILQGTNRIKEYAFITMVDRVIYAGLIVLFLVFGVRDYKLMIVADLIGKLISFFYSIYCCKEIVFQKLTNFYLTTAEMIHNISVGIKLMFSNIASTLVIGVVRFGIERSWDVATFGKVSLTLTISNLLMLFINAVGVIMYPLLRRTDEKRLPGFYMTMRGILMVVMFGFLIFYHPIRVVLTAWLPQYKESLMFMALIFPLSVYEGTMALLVNTYLKTLRKEKVMMQINMITLLLSGLMTIFTTIVFKNLNLAIISILVLIIFRFILAEIYLKKLMNLNLGKDAVLEFLLTVVFVSTGWFINSWLTTGLYVLAYIIYLVLKRKEILRCVTELKMMMKPT